MGEKRRPVENEGGGASREAGSEGAAQGGGDPGRAAVQALIRSEPGTGEPRVPAAFLKASHPLVRAVLGPPPAWVPAAPSSSGPEVPLGRERFCFPLRAGGSRWRGGAVSPERAPDAPTPPTPRSRLLCASAPPPRWVCGLPGCAGTAAAVGLSPDFARSPCGPQAVVGGPPSPA